MDCSNCDLDAKTRAGQRNVEKDHFTDEFADDESCMLLNLFDFQWASTEFE